MLGGRAVALLRPCDRELSSHPSGGRSSRQSCRGAGQSSGGGVSCRGRRSLAPNRNEPSAWRRNPAPRSLRLRFGGCGESRFRPDSRSPGVGGMQRRNSRGVMFRRTPCLSGHSRIFAGHFIVTCPAQTPSSYLGRSLKVGSLRPIQDISRAECPSQFLSVGAKFIPI